MNKKGFTLTELIATIVVLGVLIVIIIPTYIVTSRSVKQKNYESKLKYIESRAVEYASDHNITPTTITVNRLVEEGYLTKDSRSDKEYESVTNPLGGYLDCYRLFITINNSEYEAETEPSDDCTLANNELKSKDIEVYVYDSANLNELGKNSNVSWSKNDVILYVKLLNGLEDEIDKTKGVTYILGGEHITKASTIWTNNQTYNYNTYDNEYLVDASILLNSYYGVELYLKDTNQTVTKEVNVKIDKQPPTITSQSDNAWSNQKKKVEFYGSDGAGSGICGYYVGKDVLSESTSFDNDTSSKIEKELDAGIYYAYVKDCVGNISTAKIEDVKNIDTDKPFCKLIAPDREPNQNGWYNDNVRITYGCQRDEVSGCATRDITKTYTEEDYIRETINWDVYDTSGNKTECTDNVSLNIDKNPPTCKYASVPEDWVSYDVRLYFGCESDNLSRCDDDYSSMNKRYSVREGDSNIISRKESWNIMDMAFNEITCTQNVTVKIDKVIPTISVKQDELHLGTESYDFTENVEAEFGPMGGTIICDPANNVVSTEHCTDECIWDMQDSVTTWDGQSYTWGYVPVCVGMKNVCYSTPEPLTGIMDVSCYAQGNNGRRSETVTFTVKHQYTVEKTSVTDKICGTTENCYYTEHCTANDANIDGSSYGCFCKCCGWTGGYPSGHTANCGEKTCYESNKTCKAYKCPDEDGTVHADGKKLSLTDNVCYYR